jgi:hypothetical protein
MRAWRILAAIIALALCLGAGWACHNDQKIIDRHEQTLMEEDD